MSNIRHKVGPVDKRSPLEKAYNAYGRALAMKPGLAPPPTLTGAGDTDRPAIWRKGELSAFRKGLRGEPLKNSLEQIITNFLMEAWKNPVHTVPTKEPMPRISPKTLTRSVVSSEADARSRGPEHVPVARETGASWPSTGKGNLKTHNKKIASKAIKEPALARVKVKRIPDAAADVKYGEPSKSERVATGHTYKDVEKAQAQAHKEYAFDPEGHSWDSAFGAYGPRVADLQVAVKHGIARAIQTGQPTDTSDVASKARKLVGATRHHRDTLAAMIKGIRKNPLTKRAK